MTITWNWYEYFCGLALGTAITAFVCVSYWFVKRR